MPNRKQNTEKYVKRERKARSQFTEDFQCNFNNNFEALVKTNKEPKTPLKT